jgi:hypothetical protein
MPQALGSSGGHIGVGRALLRAMLTLELVEAEEIWVEAKAPVTTRAATTVRITNFMDVYLGKFFPMLQKISLDNSAEVNIRWTGI